MKIVTLPGTELNTAEALHSYLREALNLPAYYGSNLNALWDCLCCNLELPLTLVWQDFAVSKKLLGSEATLALELMREIEATTPGFTLDIK